jgi:hydroxymethylglutaryl-CoA lyase
MFARLRRELPQVRWSAHLHDTRGLGIANALAALSEGVTEFDASIGGLGGCPVVPGAAGNIASEDLVHLLDESGVRSGIDVDALMEATRLVAEFLGRELPSRVFKAGTRRAAWDRAARAAP